MAALMEFLHLAKSSSTSYYDHSNDSNNDEELDGDVVVDDEYMQNEIVKTTRETKAALEKIVNMRLSTTHPKNIPKLQSSNIAKYMEYNSGAKKRVIRLIEKPADPLQPPKHNNNDSVHKASVSPPVPVMHWPTRPVTVKDQHDWNIPPCISNFKNPKGYTVLVLETLKILILREIADKFGRNAILETLKTLGKKGRSGCSGRRFTRSGEERGRGREG